MNDIIDDIIIYITNYLDDESKIMFLSVTNQLHSLKNKIYYDEEVMVSDIHNLLYYDRFRNVMVENAYKLPKSVTHVTLTYYFKDDDIEGLIPDSVTHLTFSHHFNRSIEGCIPKSVTQLT